MNSSTLFSPCSFPPFWRSPANALGAVALVRFGSRGVVLVVVWENVSIGAWPVCAFGQSRAVYLADMSHTQCLSAYRFSMSCTCFEPERTYTLFLFLPSSLVLLLIPVGYLCIRVMLDISRDGAHFYFSFSCGFAKIYSTIGNFTV